MDYIIIGLLSVVIILLIVVIVSKKRNNNSDIVGFNNELLFPLIAFLIILFINKDDNYKLKSALTNLACLFGSLPILITLAES